MEEEKKEGNGRETEVMDFSDVFKTDKKKKKANPPFKTGNTTTGTNEESVDDNPLSLIYSESCNTPIKDKTNSPARTVEPSLHKEDVEEILVACGLPSTFPLGSNDPSDVNRVIRCLSSIANRLGENEKSQRNASEEIERLTSRCLRHEREASVMRDRIANLKRSIAEKESVMRTKDADYRRETGRQAKVIAKLETQCLRLQHLQAQYLATIRRNELQYQKLQTRTKQMLKSSCRSLKRGLETTKRLKGAEGSEPATKRQNRTSKASSSPGTANDRLSSLIDHSWSERVSELEAENEKMRASIRAMERDAAALENAHDGVVDAMERQRTMEQQQQQRKRRDLGATTNGDEVDISAAPLSMCAEALAERMRTLRARIDEKREKLEVDISKKKKDDAAVEKETESSLVAPIREQLRLAQDIIRDQDALLRTTLSFSTSSANATTPVRLSGADTTRDETPDSRMSDAAWMHEKLVREKEWLSQRKESLAEEQKRLLDEASTLDEDRVNFDNELNAFRKVQLEIQRAKRLSPSVAPLSPREKNQENVPLASNGVGSRSDASARKIRRPIVKLPLPATPTTRALLKRIGIEAKTPHFFAE